MSSIRDFYRKLKWFSANYENISFKVRVVGNDRIDLPGKIFYGPITYATDGLATSTTADFITEPKFASAYAAAAATNPWDNFTLQWRVHIVCWFANLVKHLEGDFVECGVNTGAYAAAVINYLDFNSLDKKFYLLDTFAGLDVTQITNEEKKVGIDRIYGKAYSDVYEQVKATFAPFPSVKIIRGLVPDTLPQCDTNKVAYLSIDMNVVKPEIEAANYFWDKIVKGGVMMLDDYGFPQHINQKVAFDEFARQKGVDILALPTGQAVIIKP